MKDVMRAESTPVTEENVQLMAMVKKSFNELNDYLEQCPQGRCMSIALTHLETASMFAVKEITASEHNDATPS